VHVLFQKKENNSFLKVKITDMILPKTIVTQNAKSLCVYCYTGIEFRFMSTIIHYLLCQITRLKKPGVMMALAARKQMR